MGSLCALRVTGAGLAAQCKHGAGDVTTFLTLLTNSYCPKPWGQLFIHAAFGDCVTTG